MEDLKQKSKKGRYSKPELKKHGHIKDITRGDGGPKPGDYGYGCPS